MSFISAEPQSRALLQSHNNSLLAQLDTQLRLIADRYLAFFEERRSIETTYIDSLRKLYRKAETVDGSFYRNAEPTTMRTAWDKLKDNLEKDANVQQAFVDILANDVIEPLERLKDSNHMTWKQIKEDLKRSAASYANYAETKVSKFQQRSRDVPNKRFGSRVSALFRGPGVSEVSADECRESLTHLNRLRWTRVENLGEGYDCLEELAFSPTVKDVLVKYMDGMVTACAKHDDIVKSTKAEVENALGGTDTSDLRASFHRALSLSTPPLSLYRNYRPSGYSNLIFGVPLVDHVINEDNVSKVMRMCIDEVEKKGLKSQSIYSTDYTPYSYTKTVMSKLEREKSFSLASTGDVHFAATILKRYLYDLPEPLFVLSLKEYRYYTQHRDEFTNVILPLLRSKIHELHPVHRASLEALLRHLLLVTSHSDKNRMDAEHLSDEFYQRVLGDDTTIDGAHMKKRVMADLIQIAHILFAERPSQSPPGPSSNVAEATSTNTYGSSLLSPDFPQSAEAQATGSTSRHRPAIVDGIPASAQSSFSSFPSDASPDSRTTPPQTALLSPLLGLSSSKTFMEGVETTTQEQLVPEARDTEAIKTPPDVVPLPGPTSVDEWRLHQSQLPPDPEALTIPQSPPESVLSSTSNFPLSSATSLQTRLWSP